MNIVVNKLMHVTLLTGGIVSITVVMWSCATTKTSSTTQAPQWVKDGKSFQQGGYWYFVGRAESPTEDVANQNAWNAGLIEIAKTQFPFLTHIEEEIHESRTNVDYDLKSRVKIDKIQWTGLEESASKQSPYSDTSSGTYKTYRLLRWKIADIEKERERLRKVGEAIVSMVNDARVGPAGLPSGALEIASSPAGAVITANGELIGRTNTLFKQVSAGEYAVTIGKDGYETTSQRVTIIAGQTRKIFSTLTLKAAAVVIESDPPGATLSIDGQEVGRTPQTQKILPGSHAFALKLDDYEPMSITENIVAGFRTYKYQLKRSMGVLSITSNPSPADVSVDGVLLGKSPLINKAIETGSHIVSIAIDGYVPFVEEIYVSSSVGKTVDAQLTAIPRAEAETKIMLTKNAATFKELCRSRKKWESNFLEQTGSIASKSWESNPDGSAYQVLKIDCDEAAAAFPDVSKDYRVVCIEGPSRAWANQMSDLKEFEEVYPCNQNDPQILVITLYGDEHELNADLQSAVKLAGLLPIIKAVYINGTTHCPDLAPISRNENIRTVFVDGEEACKLTLPPKVEFLYANGDVSNVSDLGHFTNLKKLSLRSDDMGDLSFVANLIKLERLSLYGHKRIKSLAPLLVLKKLQYLNLQIPVASKEALLPLTQLSAPKRIFVGSAMQDLVNRSRCHFAKIGLLERLTDQSTGANWCHDVPSSTRKPTHSSAFETLKQ